MQNELLIAILAGLGGMLGWGIADFFAKKTIDQIGDVASLAWGHIFGTATLLLMMLYNLFVLKKVIILPSDFRLWLGLILFGVGQAVVYLFLYKGFGKGQLTLLSPVFATFSGVAALISIFIFGEMVGGYLLFSLAIIFVGILLMNIDIGALKSTNISFLRVSGFGDVMIATLLAGLWTAFWGKFIGGADWLSYTFFMYTSMTITIIIISKLQKVSLLVNNNKLWKFLVFIGLFETGAYLSIGLGYSFTSRISIIALLSSAFSLPAIILSYIFLKERVTAIQAIGVAVIIVGIMALSLL